MDQPKTRKTLRRLLLITFAYIVVNLAWWLPHGPKLPGNKALQWACFGVMLGTGAFWLVMHLTRDKK